MALKLKTAAVSTPVTDAEAKSHGRITDASEDTDVTAMVKAATRAAEVQTQRALMPQTWYLTLDAWPDNAIINVPMPPLASVTSVKYLDSDGIQQTVSGTDYFVDTYSELGRIVPAYGKAWPTAQCMANAIIVEFVAGYANAAAVPDEIKHAIKMIFAHLWIHREEVADREHFEVPAGAKNLLIPHRVHSFGI